ncbi:uncharacterized protein V6R79_007194, partial [Siganus canaliculatus]
DRDLRPDHLQAVLHDPADVIFDCFSDLIFEHEIHTIIILCINLPLSGNLLVAGGCPTVDLSKYGLTEGEVWQSVVNPQQREVEVRKAQLRVKNQAEHLMASVWKKSLKQRSVFQGISVSSALCCKAGKQKYAAPLRAKERRLDRKLKPFQPQQMELGNMLQVIISGLSKQRSELNADV